MVELNINKNWTFKDFSLHKKTLRYKYKCALMSFCDYQIKEKIKFMRNVKNIIYSYNFAEWKRDLIWTYIND